MNVNVKLSLDDDTRRAVASYLAGKPVKALATRKQINQLVADLLASAMRSPVDSIDRLGGHVASAGEEFCSDDCCTRNWLLQARVNVLQHRLDTGR